MASYENPDERQAYEDELASRLAGQHEEEERQAAERARRLEARIWERAKGG